MKKSIRQRIEDKSMPEPNSGCWLWIAGLDGGGYGNMWDGSRMRMAHAISYEIFNGPIPAGYEIDHKCRLHCCINPKHLEAVPHRINVLRGTSPSAVHAAKTHCINGHEFDSANTYLNKGRRQCRECGRRAVRKYLARKRGH